MNYALSIRDHNIKPHLDLEKEVTTRGDGILTFTVRVNNGNIVDLNITEYVNAIKKYGIITGVLVQEFTFAPVTRERGASDTVGDNNLYGGDSGGSGTDPNT